MENGENVWRFASTGHDKRKRSRGNVDEGAEGRGSKGKRGSSDVIEGRCWRCDSQRGKGKGYQHNPTCLSRWLSGRAGLDFIAASWPRAGWLHVERGLRRCALGRKRNAGELEREMEIEIGVAWGCHSIRTSGCSGMLSPRCGIMHETPFIIEISHHKARPKKLQVVVGNAVYSQRAASTIFHPTTLGITTFHVPISII